MNDLDYIVSEITALLKRLGETRKNNKDCYCHELFEKWVLADLDSYPHYTWQWNLTLQEYTDIKDLLTIFSSELKEVVQHNIISCKLLQMYVSEWYKREYNGFSGLGNAFESIELTNISKEICLQLGVDETIVYHDTSGDCRWLDTLYVDGGLPLFYLKSNQNSSFRKTIEDIVEAFTEGAEYLSDDLGDLCNNQVVNQSYKARIRPPYDNEASIYDFIQAFVIKGDLLIEGFEEFTKMIQETNDRQLQKKIEVRYKVYKTPSCFQLIPQLLFRKEPNNIRYAISQERLGAWNVHPLNNRFVIEIKTRQHTIWKKQFTKCLRGDYITFPKTDRSDLSIDNRLCLERWGIFINGSSITNKAISNGLLDKGYVQMYSSDGFSWFSQFNNDYGFSAVLFDKTRDNSLNYEEEKTASIGDNNLSDLLGWKQIHERLSFSIDNKKVILYNKAGELVVEQKSKPLSNLFQGKCTERKELFLIYAEEKPSFDVVYTKESNGDIISQPLDKKDYKLEIRYGKDGLFSPLETISRCGFMEIRITRHSNNQSKIIRCFAIPKNAEIKNYDGRRTDFRNFNGLTISYNGGKALVNDNGVKRMHWGVFTEEDYRHPEATYQVTDGMVSFELSTEKPLDATVVEKESNGRVVDVGRKNRKLKMPILVMDRINVHQLPANTPVEIDKTRFYSLAYKDFIKHEYRDSYSVPNSYLELQTFTHTFSLGQDIGNCDLTDLHFVFIPTNDPRNGKTIELLNKDILAFNNDYHEEGIIVQSISNYEIPRILLKPIYVPAQGNHEELKEWEKKNARKKRINRCHNLYNYKSSNYSEALAYFDAAVNTGMYFGVFDALLGLICEFNDIENKLEESPRAANHLAQFYRYIVENSENSIRADYESLWRMADEFLFDWGLIPSDQWRDLFDDMTPVHELLQHRPWPFKNMVCLKKNANIQDDILNTILRTITGSFGRGRNSEENASFWKLKPDARVKVLNALHDINDNTISKYIQIEEE